MSVKKSIYLFLTFLTVLFFLIPQLKLYFVPNITDLAQVLQNDNTLKAALNTIIISLAVGLLCLTIGLPLAWLLTRTNLPFKKTLRSLFCLPYAIPPFVGAIGWIILANPTSGVLNQWFGQ